jgi:hypothetical protein
MRTTTWILVAVALVALSCDGQGPTFSSAVPDETPARTTSLAGTSLQGLADLEEGEEGEDPVDPEDEGQCARSAGFWCQNQDGRNPNLTPEDLEDYVEAALALLAAEGVNVGEDELLSGVCDARRQLFRQLAATALNLAAGFISAGDQLTAPDSGTVGDAFTRAAKAFTDPNASFEERQGAKDVLDRVNNNENLSNGCTPDEEEEVGEEEEDDGTAGACTLESDGMITICHVPPGNPNAKQTIRISPAAWPAHQAHGDSCGSCGS